MSSDSTTTLSRRAAEVFLQLLDRHDQLVLSRDLLRHREAIAELVNFGVMAFETHASEVMVDVMDGQESVEVEIDKLENVARYQCPETGNDRSLPLHEVELYRLQPRRLCEEIAAQLETDIDPKALDTPLIADELWFLGNANLGGATVPVFFARRLNRNLDEVMKALEPRSDTEGGLVLYSGQAPSPHLTFPARHFAVSLADAFSTESTSATLVRPFLNRIVSGLPPDRSDPIFHFDPKSGQLIIRGRKKTFKGVQRDIIAWLWKMRDSDQAGFTWSEISRAANASSRGIDDAFGKANRENWIERISDGHYRLRRT
jgi:hypothetical protein